MNTIRLMGKRLRDQPNLGNAAQSHMHVLEKPFQQVGHTDAKRYCFRGTVLPHSIHF